jgi:hypothetical protein
MGQFPILATGAAEIAPVASQGKPQASGIKMKERLLFDGRESKGCNPAIDERINLSSLVDSCPAKSRSPFPQDTVTRADQTPHFLLSDGFR